jgi:hypothetical protein
MRNHKQPSPYERINIGEEDEIIIEGYLPSTIRLIGFICLVVLTCGMFLIIIAWRPGTRVRITHWRCSLDQAKTVLLKVRQTILDYVPLHLILSLDNLLLGRIRRRIYWKSSNTTSWREYTRKLCSFFS